MSAATAAAPAGDVAQCFAGVLVSFCELLQGPHVEE